LPPVTRAPPSTTAAMAIISKPSILVGLAFNIIEARVIPVMPANAPTKQ